MLREVIHGRHDIETHCSRFHSGLKESSCSSRHHQPHNIAIPLGDGGEKKFNWASELSTTRDIQEIVKELYGVDVSADLISRLTEDLDAELKAWQSRILPSVFPIVFFDGIVVHVRGADAKVSPHTVYVALGIDLEGKKELLGLWIAKTEGAKFWLGCLTDLRNRGLEDVFICCVDGLAGFPEAIRTAYPQARVQLYVVHLVRAVLRYVATKDTKAVAADLKKIYASP